MKKGFTLIELLSVIVILGVVAVIATPKILNVVENSRISAFDSSKKLIIESAKRKYLSDGSKTGVTEYKVVDLIKENYINSNAKNPLTGKKYDENTKIVVVNEDKKINFYYVEGTTFTSIIKDLNENDGVYQINNEYVYKGTNAKNYVSFNEEIYRIVKVDSNGYVYIVKNDCDNVVEKKNIELVMKTSYNDDYTESTKKLINNNENMITTQIYNESMINSNTYISNGNDMWINQNNDYKILTSGTNEIVNSNENSNACMKNVIRLKNYLVIENGDGTQFNPYILDIKNY